MSKGNKSDPFKLTNRQLEAEDYIKTHRINELFANITSHLVFNRPEDPKKSIIDYLELLKKARIASLHPPSLFEEQNLHSMYGMLDPSGRGSITYNQYCEALRTLGFNDFEKNPEGKEEDKIKLDVFLKEAKQGLKQLNSTYKSL